MRWLYDDVFKNMDHLMNQLEGASSIEEALLCHQQEFDLYYLAHINLRGRFFCVIFMVYGCWGMSVTSRMPTLNLRFAVCIIASIGFLNRSKKVAASAPSATINW